MFLTGDPNKKIQGAIVNGETIKVVNSLLNEILTSNHPSVKKMHVCAMFLLE